MGNVLDITEIKIGDRFGRLIVMERGNKARHMKWLCQCQCGNKKEILGSSLRTQRTKSCGCLRSQFTRERRLVHDGKKNNPSEYNSWRAMKDRCENKRNHSYDHYGARGISVCDRWKNSFTSFLEDMGKKPCNKFTINRVDNDLGYYKDNCNWSLPFDQISNRSITRMVMFRGRSIALMVLAKTSGIKYSVLRQRLDRGWMVERAISEPVRGHSKTNARNI